MSIKVKELVKILKTLPQSKEVYYSDNNQFLDIEYAHNQSDRLAAQGGLVIVGMQENSSLKFKDKKNYFFDKKELRKKIKLTNKLNKIIKEHK
jgi:hypothetical protein|tara:strand:+ start:46 stop:324 length:279 start_codon:yes stop_codon:yes gene_type:complete